MIHLSSKLQRYQWRMRKRREQCPRLTLGSFRSSASHLQRESQCSSTRLSPELFSQNCCVPACRNEIYSHTVWGAQNLVETKRVTSMGVGYLLLVDLQLIHDRASRPIRIHARASRPMRERISFWTGASILASTQPIKFKIRVVRVSLNNIR